MNDRLTISRFLQDLNVTAHHRSVVEIAGDFGLRIEYRHWYPVTAGEFSWIDKVITVNTSTKLVAEKVIAHELGHFLVKQYNLSVGNEEEFCDGFAQCLLDSNGR